MQSLMSRQFFVVDFFALFFADDDFFLELETFLGNILIQPNETDEVRNCIILYLICKVSNG